MTFWWAFAAVVFGIQSAHAEKYFAYIGTYTSGKSKGIYRAEFDSTTGELSHPMLVAEAVNPSFLAIHPDGNRLYAVSETEQYQGQKSGSLVPIN